MISVWWVFLICIHHHCEQKRLHILTTSAAALDLFLHVTSMLPSRHHRFNCTDTHTSPIFNFCVPQPAPHPHPPRPPRPGPQILFRSDRSRTEEGRSVPSLGSREEDERGVEDTWWAAGLTGRRGCRCGPRCRDVRGGWRLRLKR